MRRAVVLVLLAMTGVLVGACAKPIPGTPVALHGGIVSSLDPGFPTDDSSTPSSTSGSPSTPPSSGSQSGTPSAVVNVCSLLKWTDLPYKGTDSQPSPTDTNVDTTFDQSCRWQTSVDNLDVGVSLRYRIGKSLTMKQTSGTYDVDGRKVTYYDNTSGTGTGSKVQPSCVLTMDYVGGGLGIIIVDGTFRYGTVCEQGKAVAQVMLAKEPK
ncbi:DUF3558 domain-containing protein [Solihabitans fulvus]|uniref:DUF3558 domain-containing protein n=1 Tax=Solihabitans fulvus TaxID=1892852 RepID=A0A5B2X7H4_9PSEU|nr:DUF3558 family protein [Solihabitans fulvus]KAA2259458.1 DUF3558 domain-containing protein [Solihabitans fulvus]